MAGAQSGTVGKESPVAERTSSMSPHGVDRGGKAAAPTANAKTIDLDGMFHALHDSLAEGVAIVDLKGRLLLANKAAREILDWPDSAARRIDPRKPTRPGGLGRILKEFRNRVGAHGGPHQAKIRGMDGKLHSVVIWPSPFRGPDPAAGETAAIFLDATAHRQTGETLHGRQQFQRLFLEHVNDIVCLVDRRLRLASISQSVERILGYAPEELTGRRIGELGILSGTDVKRGMGDAQRMLRGRSLPATEYQVIAKDGRGVWCEVSGAPLTERGKIAGAIVVARDITDHKRVEEALHEEQLHYKEFADSLPETVFETDIEGKIVFTNRNAFKMFRYSRRELDKGLNALQMIAPRDRPRARRNIARKIRGESFPVQEYTAVRKDGTTLPILLYSVPIIRGRKVAGLRGMLLDISDRKRAEKDLRQYADRLKAMAEMDRAVLEAHSSVELAQAALKHIRRIVPCLRASVTEFDAERGFAKVLAADVQDRTRLGRGTRLPLDKWGGFGKLLAGKINIRKNLRASSAHLAPDRVLLAEGIRSLVNIPLVSQGKLIGSLNLGFASPSGGDFEIARELAHPIALVMQRSLAEEELRRQRDLATNLVDTARAIVLVLDQQGRIARFNRFAQELTGYSEKEVLGKSWFQTFIPPAIRKRIRGLFEQNLSGKLPQGNENPILAKDGREVLVRWYKSALRDADGRMTSILAIGHDMTEIRQKEEQFRQAQKIEAVGRLAGGIAHDFNTQLTVIKGYCDLLLKELPSQHDWRRPLEEIQKASQRGAGLTSQLLTFSRQQALNPERVDLNEVIGRMTNLLRHVTGEKIRLVVKRGAALGKVWADPTHLEQALMNLVVNARDAMGDGGRLTIQTANVNLGEAHVREHVDATAGPHVRLTVSDTGVGIDPETRRRIFDPFFTTKPVGRGTGLGLAMVYGFVKQSRGHIVVHSAPHKGAAFHVYLPRA